MKAYENELIRLLFDAVMDTYDEVRETATVLLAAISSETLAVSLEEAFSAPSTRLAILASSGETVPDVLTVVERGVVMMRRTGRADHADGAGRICGLLFECSSRTVGQDSLRDRKEKKFRRLISTLENDITMALSDLPTAVLVAPLHGSLISLR